MAYSRAWGGGQLKVTTPTAGVWCMVRRGVSGRIARVSQERRFRRQREPVLSRLSPSASFPKQGKEALSWGWGMEKAKQRRSAPSGRECPFLSAGSGVPS